MIISTKKGTPQVELDRIIDSFEKQGLSVTLIRGTDYKMCIRDRWYIESVYVS